MNSSTSRTFARLLYLLPLLLLVSACQPFVDQDQTQRAEDTAFVLSPGQSIGQTFVAQHGGLNGVEFWLAPGEGASGELRFHLRSDSESGVDIRTTVVPLSEVAEPGFYRFVFESLRASHGEYLYAFIAFEGEGDIQVGAGPGDVYINGALYQNHVPEDAQAAFRLGYDPIWMSVELMGAAVRGVGLVGLALLLYAVPGWAILAWVWPDTELMWAERLALAVGLSLALYPILLLWTDLVGLHLGALYAWLPVVGGVLALVWRYRDWRPRQGWEELRRWVHSDAVWPDVTLLVILALVFGVRLLVVRTLDAPMWGDSYQHTMIAQLLVDNGGLFDSWEPYADLRSFTYHFGFHTAVASFHWITGISMPKAVIWVGQLLNGLAVFTPYVLAYRMGRNRWVGAIAVLLAGLLSPMPMYYVNWGRYTQLAGQVILPIAVWLSWEAFEAEQRDWRLIGLAWLGVGGLALTHYRVLIFYVIFVLAWLILNLSEDRYKAFSRVIAVALGSALLFLPWFVHIAGGRIVARLGLQLTTGAKDVSRFTQEYNAIGDLTLYLRPMSWLLLVVAIGWGFWRRKREALVVSVWWFVVLVATNPNWLHLPGSGAISNFALFIAVYLPWAVMVGGLTGSLASRLGSINAVGIMLSLLMTAIALAGAGNRMADLRVAQHTMVTKSDLRAMTWIRENTHRDSRFLVNFFFAYDDSVIVGSDAGWWLPLLAGRENNVPPLNYGTEVGTTLADRSYVNALAQRLKRIPFDSREMLLLLDDYDITYLYVGQQHGSVNYQGTPILDPLTLIHNEHLDLVYHQDRVWVFKAMSLE